MEVITMAEPVFSYSLSRTRYMRMLIGTMVLLLILGVLKEIHVEANIGQGNLHPVLLKARSLFDLNGEQNIPSWFSTMNLLNCFLLTLVMALAKKKAGEKFTFQWFVLALIFFFLSFDEAFAIHEELNAPLRSALGLGGVQLIPDYTSLFYYAWIIPYGIGTSLIGILYIPFLRHLPRETRIGFLTAGALFVTGALILEAVEGWIQSAGVHRLIYISFYTVEELMEMGGIILFINALLVHMGQRWRVLAFQL